MVSTPLKNMKVSQLGWLFHIIWQIKKCLKPPTRSCCCLMELTWNQVNCFQSPKPFPPMVGTPGTPGTRPSRGKSKRSPRCNCKRLAETCDPSGPITDPSGSIHSIPSIATFQPFWGAILALNSDCIWINVAGKIWEVWLRLRSSCDSSAPGIS